MKTNRKTPIQGGRSWFARIVLTAFLLGILIPVCHAALPPRDGNGFFKLNSGRADYWGYYPENYNENTPVSLFIWMHGCGGQAYGDLFGVAPYATRVNQSYIAISLGGRDGACWQTNNDAEIVRAALNHVSTVFNINPRKIYIGGYSSGGDMAYRFGFENSTLFAGILGHNSSPFRDTGRTGPQLMAAARWKINVAHLLHNEDATYPPAGVRAELATLAQNGFPVNKEERPGTHFDDTLINGTYATIHDQITYLLPYLDKGWTSPAPPVINGQITVTKGETVGKGGELLLNGGTTLDFGSVAGRKRRDHQDHPPERRSRRTAQHRCEYFGGGIFPAIHSTSHAGGRRDGRFPRAIFALGRRDFPRETHDRQHGW